MADEPMTGREAAFVREACQRIVSGLIADGRVVRDDCPSVAVKMARELWAELVRHGVEP